MMPMPPIWSMLAQYWHLSRCQSRRFWLALVHTHDTAAMAWRQVRFPVGMEK